MTETHTCPRRATEIGPWGREEGADRWDPRHGLVMQERGCTFCGSMHPDDFLNQVEEGYRVGPTDKSYKAYLLKPPTDEDRARHRQAAERLHAGDPAAIERHVAEVPVDGATVGKFYFQHLDTPERRQRFIDLFNDGVMTLGYPGHFYVRPYFTRDEVEQ